MATTTTTTKHRQGTLFGFPVWAWVAIAVIFAITATILTVALTRGTPVDPAAEQAIAAEREAAIERSIAAATERLTAQAWAYVLANPEAVADVSRLPVPASQVTGMTEEQLAEIAGLVALVNQAADQGR